MKQPITEKAIDAIQEVNKSTWLGKRYYRQKMESGGDTEMKTIIENMLPKTTTEITNGGLYLQRVKCGKQNCRCARGELHSAYYFFTRRDGKLVKMYVRKADVKEFSDLVNLASDERAERRQSSQSSNDLLRRLRLASREYETTLKLYKENYT